MTEQFTEIDYQCSGSVGWLTLAGPEGNRLTSTTVRELHRALDLVDRDGGVQFLVVTGAGRTFCAGPDMDYVRRTMAVEHGFDRLINEFLEPFVEFVARLRTVAGHVIAAVNGPCAAAGLWIVRACDFAIGSESPAVLAERVDRLIDRLSAPVPSSPRAVDALNGRPR
jgi:2-(1,2-epoxy-1,2-dihydrophenyl)acetyl-CoA isomerase